MLGAPAPETSAVRSAWARGDGALSLRPLVEAAAAADGDVRAAAKALASSTAGWEGLWLARIEHFEKVAWTGLAVRPHYALSASGGIVSHVHVAVGPLRGWLSASGAMRPAATGVVVDLVFDDFWVGADAPRPRESPSEAEASVFDQFTRALGRAAFFEGLAGFPVDYADDGGPADNPLVAFRFTPLNSLIVAERRPDGEAPWRPDLSREGPTSDRTTTDASNAMRMLPMVGRLTAHVALAATLRTPLITMAEPPPAASVAIISYVDAGTKRSDPALSSAVRDLVDSATPPAAVDFGKMAGEWRVVSAPLIDSLSQLALTDVDITYRIGAPSNIGATVRYDSKLFGSGWLCTDGSIYNVADAASPTVRLIWERIWWQPGGSADKPPLDPDAAGAATMRPLVQALGRAGFSEDLAVFPVRYADDTQGLAVFEFQGLTVAVRRA